jgi:hypothetical protein
MVDSDDSDDDDAIMAFALASSAQLAFLIDWDSDSSDEDRTWWITGPFLARRTAHPNPNLNRMKRVFY